MGDPYAGKVLVAKVPKGSDNGLPVVIYRVFRIPKGYPWTAHDGYRRQEERSNQPVQRDAVIHDVVLDDEVLLDVLHGPGLALVTKPLVSNLCQCTAVHRLARQNMLRNWFEPLPEIKMPGGYIVTVLASLSPR